MLRSIKLPVKSGSILVVSIRYQTVIRELSTLSHHQILQSSKNSFRSTDPVGDIKSQSSGLSLGLSPLHRTPDNVPHHISPKVDANSSKKPILPEIMGS
jgi:hypothetical protein